MKTGLSLRERLAIPDGQRPFLVLVELPPVTPGNIASVETFLREAAAKNSTLQEETLLAGFTIPQNPRGNASLSPADVFSLLREKDLWAGFDVIPHVSAKDANLPGLRTSLLGLRELGLESVLAITGDIPGSAAGVFEVDSLGLLELVGELNFQSFQRSRKGGFDGVHQFFSLAAVSPFKYTEASQIQQYLKMKKKIRAGAEALITQMGWDSRKSEELFRYLGDEKIRIPVFGNVYLLSTITPAARLMFEGNIPGCYVNDVLFERVKAEPFEDHLQRAAQQVAMYRDLGAAGVDLGGFPDFKAIQEVLKRAEEIGQSWRNFRENLDFGAGKPADGLAGFYLYDENGTRRKPKLPNPPFRKRMFDFLHSAFLTRDRGAYPVVKNILKSSRSLRLERGALYKLALAGEKSIKSFLFDCKACGDCFLPENFGVCTLGPCEKELPNPPCGDATPDGMCGNDRERPCVAETIYRFAASQGPSGLEELAGRINPPRLSSLDGTASVLNFLFGKDHARRKDMVLIGESLHASIPKTQTAMKVLLDGGPGAFETSSGALRYLISLVESQVRHGADYIDVNVDAFGGGDPETRIQMMRNLVRLVRAHSRGVPVCVDSDDPDVLAAGLDEWYRDAPSSIRTPLLNSVKTITMDRILPLRRNFSFKFIGLLIDAEASGGAEACSSDDQHGLALTLFREARGKHGFAPGDIFFDAAVFPLAIDMPMVPGRPGYAYRAFQTMRKIKSDEEMKGIHLVLGISNAVRDLPGRRTGVCRAYLAVAKEHGLDAAIVNVMHGYGLKPAASDLLEFVRVFSRQDGSPEAAQSVVDSMTAFCQANRRQAPSRPEGTS